MPRKKNVFVLTLANLFIEHIGYECFCRSVSMVQPKYVSCIIQLNVDAGFVSDSPYLHVFDALERVHHQMQEDGLTESMKAIGYCLCDKKEEMLPIGKNLLNWILFLIRFQIRFPHIPSCGTTKLLLITKKSPEISED